MFNSEKIMNWVYWGTEEEQNKRAWAREVKRAKDFLERRQYGISKYKYNPVATDFAENL